MATPTKYYLPNINFILLNHDTDKGHKITSRIISQNEDLF